jgi:hypothetical protein
MWKWAFFMVCVVCGVIGFGRWLSAVKEVRTADAVTPVECSCSCPEQKLLGSNSIVADGYNVNVVVDGEKWTPPALLSEEEQGYVTLCRKEDPELIGHPDLSFTKTYKLWHQCYDELMYHSCFDDELAQVCWQSDAF